MFVFRSSKRYVSNGVLEYWSSGVSGFGSITPLLQYSVLLILPPAPTLSACTLWPCACGTNNPNRHCPTDERFLPRHLRRSQLAPWRLSCPEAMSMLRGQLWAPTPRRLTRRWHAGIRPPRSYSSLRRRLGSENQRNRGDAI